MRRLPNVTKFLVLSLSLLLILSVWMGCQKGTKMPTAPDQNQAVVLNKANPMIQTVMAVQERHTADLLAKPDVVGTAVGLTEDGKPAVMVYTKTIALKKSLGIPATLEGLPVVVEVVGEIHPMKGKPPKPGGGVDHKAKQTPPIQLGTSGGWRYDLANGYCCGGTLGSLVQIGSKKYILSNYHVFESDIVSGGNNRVAQTGDPVIQPGLIDVGCNASNAQDVATLVKKSSLPGNNVDCAIAEIISGMVDESGAILEIGTLSSQTVAAYLKQAVKKSGRTTGLTRSSISGLNATIQVTYEDECAGSTAFTKTFTGQIVIKNNGSRFLDSGDSGSLMVEDVATNPRAVGLLFAGSSRTAIANPIDEVLAFLNATMVGN
ncbi:MAG: hypothetical protein GXO74_09220 [Calditrichaeota bacterium]|nr:hypothetical protein [Calditrichota bacterium]